MKKETLLAPGTAILLLALIGGAILLVFVVGGVLEIFDDPESRTSDVIYRYQTCLAGAVAVPAAVVTVLGVYAAANMPVAAEEQRRRQQRIRDQRIGAAVLAGEITTAIVELIKVKAEIEDADDPAEFAFPPFPIPEHLRSFEVIATQIPEVAHLTAVFVSDMTFRSALEGIFIGRDDPAKSIKQIDDVIARAHELGQLLTDIVEPGAVFRGAAILTDME